MSDYIRQKRFHSLVLIDEEDHLVSDDIRKFQTWGREVATSGQGKSEAAQFQKPDLPVCVEADLLLIVYDQDWDLITLCLRA